MDVRYSPLPTASRLHAVTPSTPNFAQYLEPVTTAVRVAARKYRLSVDEIEDLQSDMWVRLLADDGRALRRFRGRSSLPTYLVTVARNLVLDRRDKAWGKWRPSVTAVRCSGLCVELEQLIMRDGFSRAEAVEWICTARPEVSRSELYELSRIIPRRSRRRIVTADLLEQYESGDPSPDSGVLHAEEERTASALAKALTVAISALPQQDRKLLLWRYVQGRRISEIAEALGLDQHALYRRCESVARRVRVALVAAGFDCAKVRDVLVAHAEYVQMRLSIEPLPRVPAMRQSA